MKRILIVYLPFCTPATPPYSASYLCSFLKKNSLHHIEIIDLNLEFHKKKFADYSDYCKNTLNWKDYNEKTKEFIKTTKKTYSENNKSIVQGKEPELFNELFEAITSKKPDIVAFSIVYSSQAFYAFALLKELKKIKSIQTVIGGPAVNEKLISVSDACLKNELELLNFIEEKDIDHNALDFDFHIDYSHYKLKDYFTPCTVIPLKTCSTCYYKQCTFCSHYSTIPYYEFSLEMIKKTVINSKQKYFFLIDDMIHTKRLLELAEIFKPLNIKWTCQLRPTKGLDIEVLKKLKESGLAMIMWGIESGSQRILDLIKKGTNTADISAVLKDSHSAGIKNIAYIIFGFPTETKKEFIETIDFLESNKESIDLVSTSVFGLQKGTFVYNNPEKFGIAMINKEQRTVLEPKISYSTISGLTQEQAKALRNSYKKTIEKINRFPKTMNFFREHMFCLL